MDNNFEQVLIIYSTHSTLKDDLIAAEQAVSEFMRPESSVRARALAFQIPSGAAPGATLGTELTTELRNSIGAIAFLDDLRPNLAYELGFFHGQGRTVLLLTRRPVDSIWTAISDIAGAALVSLEVVDVKTAVHSYLTRVYDTLGFIDPWPAPELPLLEHNLLNSLSATINQEIISEKGQFGKMIEIRTWEGITVPLGFNLLPSARFKILIRAATPESDYSIYFRVRFSDRIGKKRRVWLGLTSARRRSGWQAEERNLPAQAATEHWRLLTGRFTDLLRAGLVLGGSEVEYIENVRFRAGRPASNGAIDIGFLQIIGRD